MSKEALQIAEKRRDAKGKGEKERYPFECRVPSETAALAVGGRAVAVASSPPAAASAAAPVAPAAAVFAKAERRGGAGQEAMEFCEAGTCALEPHTLSPKALGRHPSFRLGNTAASASKSPQSRPTL